MAEERHTTAFVVGAVLGGLAGAAFVLWTAKRSGVQTRALIAEKTEAVLFRLTGMDKTQAEGPPMAAAPPPSEAVAHPGHDVAADTTPISAPVAGVHVDRGDGARLPTTFRGEVLTETPADIVLDGPRPVPVDR